MNNTPIEYADMIWSNILAIMAAIVMLGAIPIVYAILRDRKRKRNLTETRKRNFARWTEWVKRNRHLPVVESSLMLEHGEVCHHSARATLVEPRAVRVSNHGGAAMRTRGGLILGGARSVSESHDEWRKISEGTVYVASCDIRRGHGQPFREPRVNHVRASGR